MDYKEIYKRWIDSDKVDEATKNELSNLSEKEIEDRFYRDLEFGTGGLRGVMAAGTNRMNIIPSGEQHRDSPWKFLIAAERLKRVLRLPMIPETIRQALQKRRQVCFVQTELKHICLTDFARHLSFRLQ